MAVCAVQVYMTSEFSTTTAQLSALQMELTGCRHREAELKTQLATAVAESQKNSQSWASVKQSHDGRCSGRSGGLHVAIGVVD